MNIFGKKIENPLARKRSDELPQHLRELDASLTVILDPKRPLNIEKTISILQKMYGAFAQTPEGRSFRLTIQDQHFEEAQIKTLLAKTRGNAAPLSSVIHPNLSIESRLLLPITSTTARTKRAHLLPGVAIVPIIEDNDPSKRELEMRIATAISKLIEHYIASVEQLSAPLTITNDSGSQQEEKFTDFVRWFSSQSKSNTVVDVYLRDLQKIARAAKARGTTARYNEFDQFIMKFGERFYIKVEDPRSRKVTSQKCLPVMMGTFVQELESVIQHGFDANCRILIQHIEELTALVLEATAAQLDKKNVHTTYNKAELEFKIRVAYSSWLQALLMMYQKEILIPARQYT